MPQRWPPATAVRPQADYARPRPVPHSQLDRPCPPGRYLSTAGAVARRASLPSGVGQVAACCAAGRSTIRRRTCVPPTATRTGRPTTTMAPGSAWRALRGRRMVCGARIRRGNPSPERAEVRSPSCRPLSAHPRAEPAEGNASPAGLVGRPARRPRRACSFHRAGRFHTPCRCPSTPP